MAISDGGRRCLCCGPIGQPRAIHTPGELADIIRRLKAVLADRKLIATDYWPADRVRVDCGPFERITADGAWDDVLDYFFECPACGRLFELAVETYHGCGGQWKPVNRDMSEHILARIKAIFPEDERAVAVRLLSRCNTREMERVRLVMLGLCDGDLKRLEELVRAARKDYRDILMWAENRR